VVEDDQGRILILTAPPERIISLVPSSTELIVALGAAESLVARTTFDRDPALAHLPSLGGGLTPNLEAMVALRPDLVVASPDGGLQTALGRLEGMGVPLYAGASGTMEDLRRTIRNLGSLLGRTQAADSLLESMAEGFRELAGELEGVERPTVFYVVWHDPPMTTGPGTFLDFLIRSAGGENLFADAATGWPQVSLEEVVRRQPDVVVLAGEPEEVALRRARLQAAPGWRELRAVREGRVVMVEGELMNRPGPRVVEAARALAAALH